MGIVVEMINEFELDDIIEIDKMVNDLNMTPHSAISIQEDKIQMIKEEKSSYHPTF